MHRERECRSRVGLQTLSIRPEVFDRFFLEIPCLAGTRGGNGVKHPRLRVEVAFTLHHFLLQEGNSSIEDVVPHWNSGAACQSQTPDDVTRHVVITLAFFPPTPAAIGMLE